MRINLGAALAGLAVVAGGATTAGAAQAQPYGYYYNPPPATYYYNPPPATGYYAAPAPGYVYEPGAAGLAGAVIGSMIGAMPAYGEAVPVDRYGPDPNGRIAPDGRRIKCKLQDNWDADHDAYVTHRECWEED